MKYLSFISIAAAMMFSIIGCSEKYTEYSGPEYIAFSDTLSICPVKQDGAEFDVNIASTKAVDYDRTFGVEVVSSKSNAVLGYHFDIPSQTVTIPAGQRAASLKMIGRYDNIADGDSLSVTLSLVSVEDRNWDLYGQQTRVLLKKVCPFDINNFAGWCQVSSVFWVYYNSKNTTRLVRSVVAEDEENTIILKDFVMDGYDVRLRFDNSDELNPTVRLGEDQRGGDTRVAFSYIYGDGYLMIADSPAYPNTLNICSKYAITYLTYYVKDVGTVGLYPSILEWYTDEELHKYE